MACGTETYILLFLSRPSGRSWAMLVEEGNPTAVLCDEYADARNTHASRGSPRVWEETLRYKVSTSHHYYIQPRRLGRSRGTASSRRQIPYGEKLRLLHGKHGKLQCYWVRSSSERSWAAMHHYASPPCSTMKPVSWSATYVPSCAETLCAVA